MVVSGVLGEMQSQINFSSVIVIGIVHSCLCGKDEFNEKECCMLSVNAVRGIILE